MFSVDGSMLSQMVARFHRLWKVETLENRVGKVADGTYERTKAMFSLAGDERNTSFATCVIVNQR